MPIPSTLATIPEAAAALDEYRAVDPHLALAQAIGYAYAATTKPWAASQTYARLERVPGPGPLVTVAQNGSQRLLGRSDAGRGSYRVTLPAVGPYGVVGPVGPFLDGSTWAADSLGDLVTDHQVVLALAARAEICAHLDSEANRIRQSGHLLDEAAQLIDLAAELEALVPVLGPAFLDSWRALAASQAPASPPVTYRPASIRSTR